MAKLVQVQLMIGNGVDYEYLRMFEDFGDLNIRVTASPAGYLMPDPAGQQQAGRGFGGRRRPTDVIVLYDQIYDIPAEGQLNLRRYVEAGKGLHNALTDFQRWPFWYRDVVGGAYTMPDDRMPKLAAPGVWDPTSDKTIGWIGPHPKAKVFAMILGHSADSHAHPMYRRVVHNAILWAGG